MFEFISLLLLSLFLIAIDTKLGLLILWALYILFNFWRQPGSFTEVIDYTMNHGFDIIMLVIAYLVLGSIWSMFKWYLFMKESSIRYKELIDKYNSLSKEDRPTWNQYASNYDIVSPPKVSSYKNKITYWISFWWYSMIRTIFGDWMQKLWNAIYKLFYNIYDAIAKSVYSNIETPK